MWVSATGEGNSARCTSDQLVLTYLLFLFSMFVDLCHFLLIKNLLYTVLYLPFAVLNYQPPGNPGPYGLRYMPPSPPYGLPNVLGPTMPGIGGGAIPG